MSYVKRLTDVGIIKPPSYVDGGLIYEVIIGSNAYGVSSDNSDLDIVGICIPDKDIIFPHLRGEIEGFGTQVKRFHQFQKHGVVKDNTIYDISVYNIVKYFRLAMNCNPNIIDSLFVNDKHITYITPIGKHLTDNRKIFLSKEIYHRFKGYIKSQYNKLKNINNKDIVDQVLKFENNYGIPNNTKFSDVEKEMNSRGLF